MCVFAGTRFEAVEQESQESKTIFEDPLVLTHTHLNPRLVPLRAMRD